MSSLPARFWAKVIPEPNSGCWLWLGCVNALGYGVFGRLSEDGSYKSTLAHRMSLEDTLGRSLVGFALHSCDNPCCVNPRHLREGTHVENMSDKKARGRASNRHVGKPLCDSGHEFTIENTYVTHEGWRTCRKCKAEAQARRRSCRRTDKQADAANHRP